MSINPVDPAQDRGLIFGILLDRHGHGSDLDWQQIESHTNDNSLPWLHLNFTDPHAREWLRDHSGIDRMIVSALLDEDSRPHVLEDDDGLLVILRGVNTNPGADPEDMVSIRIWLEPNRVVSTRRRKLLSALNLRDALIEGKGPSSSGEFLVMLVERLNARIEDAVETLDLAIEAAEARFESQQTVAYGGEFSALRRQTARIRRYLAPQRDALERLSRIKGSVLGADHCEKLRESANQMTRYLEDLDLVRERSMVAQEELLGRMAQQQNQRMYVLSLVAAVFLPLSFLTGLMGMNVAGLPGTEDPWSFAILVVLMVGCAFGILGLFKWQKWL